MGEPGSINRNPYISAIFHETNLAETKGSGIRTMRRLMEEVSMMPPTFESDRENNKFTVRLLLHHLLNEDDIHWLKHFDSFNLSDNQKRILIFVRELSAVDNSSARQINGSEAVVTNLELRKLREIGLLDQKGGGRYSYYLPSRILKETYINFDDNQSDIENKTRSGIDKSSDLSALPANLSALPFNLSALPGAISTLPSAKIQELSKIKAKIDNLPKRINDKSVLEHIILEICHIQSFKLNELSGLLDKSEKYIFREFVKPLLDRKKLYYKYADMINHPEQAYKTTDNLIDNE